MPWYYRLRFTNWLMAKPWPRKNGWHYRTMYRMQREGCDGWLTLPKGRVFYPSMVQKPASPLRAAWRALTFPHVHHQSELEE